MKRNKRTKAAGCCNNPQKTLTQFEEPWIGKYLFDSAVAHLDYVRSENKKIAAIMGLKPKKPLTSRQIIAANRKFLKDICARQGRVCQRRRRRAVNFAMVPEPYDCPVLKKDYRFLKVLKSFCNNNKQEVVAWEGRRKIQQKKKKA